EAIGYDVSVSRFHDGDLTGLFQVFVAVGGAALIGGVQSAQLVISVKDGSGGFDRTVDLGEPSSGVGVVECLTGEARKRYRICLAWSLPVMPRPCG
ncbi:MAG: hypothetical protein ACI97B_004511, partial [Verrucomicrobiales bacterium]